MSTRLTSILSDFCPHKHTNDNTQRAGGARVSRLSSYEDQLCFFYYETSTIVGIGDYESHYADEWAVGSVVDESAGRFYMLTDGGIVRWWDLNTGVVSCSKAVAGLLPATFVNFYHS
eukprot:TRINITY_DN789_c0_g1_i2.p1 TRINITY_DN789_c0_g1~~TRINITY_DN789_c0_g1_i2.p1  ORF type:complete len:117 (-),score=8.59 TRINITY_DN789_c0_g1_i2:43-393(-)